MSATAPNNLTPTKPTADQLLRAAELKAEGHSWPAIGKDLNVDHATVTRWRVDHPSDWKIAAGRFRQFALGDALGEALLALRLLTRSKNEKTSLAAAGWIVRYWSAGYRHRPRTQKAAEPDTFDENMEVFPPGMYEQVARLLASRPAPLPPLGEDEGDDTPPDDGGEGGGPDGPNDPGGGGGVSDDRGNGNRDCSTDRPQPANADLDLPRKGGGEEFCRTVELVVGRSESAGVAGATSGSEMTETKKSRWSCDHRDYQANSRVPSIPPVSLAA